MKNIKKILVMTPVVLMALGLLLSRASAKYIILSPETITPTPPPSDPEVNTVFDVNITVADVINLYAWQIVLWFQNDVLEAVDAIEGPFLKQVGSTYFAFLHDNIVNDYNGTHGYIFVGCSGTWDPALGGANGTGVLCTIKFNGTSVGSSSLIIGDNPPYVTYLEDKDGGEISFEVVVKQVNVVPEFPLTIIAPILLLTTVFIILCKKRNY